MGCGRFFVLNLIVAASQNGALYLHSAGGEGFCHGRALGCTDEHSGLVRSQNNFGR